VRTRLQNDQRASTNTGTVYEIRKWFDDHVCLYTDDTRVSEVAGQRPDVVIAATYFRDRRDQQAFAWDIVGRRDVVTGLVGDLGKSVHHRRQ
jgi:hypothetical protein